MRDGEAIITEKMLRGLIEMAKEANAEQATYFGHHMGTFGGWCLRLTVCRHSFCEREDEAGEG